MVATTSILRNGAVEQTYGEEISPFALDLGAATVVYEKMAAICEAHADAISAHYAAKNGHAPRNPSRAFSVGAWSPESHARSAQVGRQSGEYIDIHVDYRAPELLAALADAGLTPMVLVQKHDWWPRDRYRRMTEEEQMDFDLQAREIGFHLSGWQIRRLVAASRWTDAYARAYAPHYETED